MIKGFGVKKERMKKGRKEGKKWEEIRNFRKFKRWYENENVV